MLAMRGHLRAFLTWTLGVAADAWGRRATSGDTCRPPSVATSDLVGLTSTPIHPFDALHVDPGVEIVAAVEDAAAEPKAGRAGAEVAPVPEGGDRGPQQLGGLGDGEQLGCWLG